LLIQNLNLHSLARAGLPLPAAAAFPVWFAITVAARLFSLPGRVTVYRVAIVALRRGKVVLAGAGGVRVTRWWQAGRRATSATLSLGESRSARQGRWRRQLGWIGIRALSLRMDEQQRRRSRRHTFHIHRRKLVARPATGPLVELYRRRSATLEWRGPTAAVGRVESEGRQLANGPQTI
jgi:hypothetical protein